MPNAVVCVDWAFLHIDKMKIFAIGMSGRADCAQARPRNFQEARPIIKIPNKNKPNGRGAVAHPLPSVARMLPSGCHLAAAMFPESCLQVAESLP